MTSQFIGGTKEQHQCFNHEGITEKEANETGEYMFCVIEIHSTDRITLKRLNI